MAAIDRGVDTSNIPAPVKGLNTALPLAQLQPQFAIELDNFICRPDAVTSRKGTTNHVTGFTDPVLTIFSYISGAIEEMYGATDDGIFDITSEGVVGASVEPCTRGRGVACNFATTADQYVYFLNGADKPKLYDGSTWVAVDGVSTPAITGVTTDTLNHGVLYRNRLFFLQNDYLGFWYLPVDSVGGAAAQYALGSLFRRGGYAVTQATWTIDGGNGTDDYYAVCSSEGEVAVFSGSDPSAIDSWNLQGVYYIGKPVGPNSFVKYGGDLLLMCAAGLFPLSKALNSVSIDRRKALSANIEPTLVAAVRDYGTEAGWAVEVIPSHSLILVNAPLLTTKQFVMQTQSRGWSTFSGIAATSWHQFGSGVYCSVGLTVRRAFTGTSDAGTAIDLSLCTAYSRFNSISQSQPLNWRPIIRVNQPITYSIGLAQDYLDNYILQSVETDASMWAVWGSSLWGEGLWGSTNLLQNFWLTLAGRAGIVNSIKWSASVTNTEVQLISFDARLAQQGTIM
jgi:hypothetical protein